MNRYLWIAAGVSLAFAAFVYWWVYGPSWNARRSPEVLRKVALESSAAEERERAAVELGDWAEPADEAGNRPRRAEAAVEYLMEVLEQSDDPVVQTAAIDGLRRARHWKSMPALLAAMEHESVLIRGRAARTVETLIGATYGFNPEAPPPERAALLGMMRGDYERMEAHRRGQAATADKNGP